MRSKLGNSSLKKNILFGSILTAILLLTAFQLMKIVVMMRHGDPVALLRNELDALSKTNDSVAEKESMKRVRDLCAQAGRRAAFAQDGIVDYLNRNSCVLNGDGNTRQDVTLTAIYALQCLEFTLPHSSNTEMFLERLVNVDGVKAELSLVATRAIAKNALLESAAEIERVKKGISDRNCTPDRE